MWNRLKIVLVFALAGPAIGGWVACPLLACTIELSNGTLAIAPIFGVCSILGPIGGYLFGLVPAIATGVMLALTSSRPAARPARRAVGVAVAVTLVVIGGYALLQIANGEAGSGTFLLPASLVAAAVSGAACWRLVELLSWRPRRALGDGADPMKKPPDLGSEGGRP